MKVAASNKSWANIQRLFISSVKNWVTSIWVIFHFNKKHIYDHILQLFGTRAENNFFIAESSYKEFRDKACVVINGGSAIPYSQLIPPVDSGNVSIETNVSNDYGERTKTICSRTTATGENVTCGNCTTLNCHFAVSEIQPGDLFTIIVEIDLLQGSFIQFAFAVKGMSYIYEYEYISIR